MSAVSLMFLLSPAPTLQSKYAFLAPSRAELRRCRLGDRHGIIRGEKDSVVTRPRNRVAAKAGIGRYSGAVHGSNTRRGRKRRPTLRPDECEGNSSGDENDSFELQQTTQRQGDNLEETYEASGLDGLVQDDVEAAVDSTDSHQRYLSELGILQNNADREYQLQAGIGAGDDSWVSIGTEGDLGYRHMGTVAISNSVKEDRKRASGTWKGGDQVVPLNNEDIFANEERTKAKDRKSARVSRTRKNRDDLSEPTVYLAELEPVAAAVINNRGLMSQQSRKEVDENVNSVIRQGNFKPEPSVQVTENGHLNNWDTSISSKAGDSGKNRKQRRKISRRSGWNAGVNTESPSVERQVRIVEGEAEQPSVLHVNQKRRRGKGDNTGGIISAGANVDLRSSVMAVIEPEGREGSGMANYKWETLESGIGDEECVTLPEEGPQGPVNQSVATLSDSTVVPVKVSQAETTGAFRSLGSEQSNGAIGNRPESVNAKAERIVIETDADAEDESRDTVENGGLAILLQASVVGSINSTSAMLDSKSVMESSNEEFLTRHSLPIQERPSAVASEIDTENAPSADTVILVNPLVEQAVQVVSKVVELPVQVASKVVELPTNVASKVIELPIQVASKVVELPVQVASKVAELPGAVVDQATQVGSLVVEQVAEILPDAVTEQVGQVVSQVSATAEQVVQVAESVTSTANQVVEQVTEKVTEILSFDDDDESDSDDEFESYKTSDDPAFRGSRGLANFVILQEDQGVQSKIYDFYTYMLKQPLPKFAAAMFSAPIIVSVLFTLLYLPEYKGLAFDDTARDFFAATEGDDLTLRMSWGTVFQVFMFSLSLSTGLQPELAPLTPYTLIVANINALVAQLVFVFLSGAVFARLSQPAQPVRCSTVALVSTSTAQRKKENAIKVLVTRYVLAGPQPCELVDVKVDLTYKYNTRTTTGSYFRATQTLKLVRPEIAFLTHGMLVRHVIDSTSPLYQRTPEMLKKEDAVFVLSVVGLERSSMQSVFHVQHYCVCDDHVIWNAEFEDLILINSKRSKRIVDHSRLSMWRPIQV